MKFTEYLTEANWDNNRIEKWLSEMGVKNYTINSDKTVDVDGDVSLFQKKLQNIPITFGKVTGDFSARHNNLITLRGFPNVIGGDLSVSFNPTLRDFKNATTSIVKGSFNAKDVNFTSFENISNALSEVGGYLAVDAYDCEIQSGGLGLVLMKLGEQFMYSASHKDFYKAMEIINKYMDKPGDVFLCQEELITANLDRFATL